MCEYFFQHPAKCKTQINAFAVGLTYIRLFLVFVDDLIRHISPLSPFLSCQNVMPVFSCHNVTNILEHYGNTTGQKACTQGGPPENSWWGCAARFFRS